MPIGLKAWVRRRDAKMAGDGVKLLQELLTLTQDSERASDLRKAAQERLAILDRERAAITAVLELVDDGMLQPSNQDTRLTETRDAAGDPGNRGVGTQQAQGRPILIREAIEAILTEEDHPVRIEALVEPVEKMRGVKLGGKTPQHSLYGTISQTESLTTRRGWVGLTRWAEEKWNGIGNASTHGGGV